MIRDTCHGGNLILLSLCRSFHLESIRFLLGRVIGVQINFRRGLIIRVQFVYPAECLFSCRGFQPTVFDMQETAPDMPNVSRLENPLMPDTRLNDSVRTRLRGLYQGAILQRSV